MFCFSVVFSSLKTEETKCYTSAAKRTGKGVGAGMNPYMCVWIQSTALKRTNDTCTRETTSHTPSKIIKRL